MKVQKLRSLTRSNEEDLIASHSYLSDSIKTCFSWCWPQGTPSSFETYSNETNSEFGQKFNECAYYEEKFTYE